MSTFRLGIDLGTSAVKVVALDAAGTVAATAEAAFPTRADLPGQAEQETGDWLAAVAAAAADLRRRLGSGSPAVSAIGLAGQLPTLVCLDADDRPLGPAVTWRDARADAWAAGRLDERRRAALYRSTGMPIDGRYLAPMYRFHWRHRDREVRRVLSAKDFLCHALTGRAVTDPSTAAGYGVYALTEGSWDPVLCTEWELDPRLLPEIRPTTAMAGPLRAAGARLLGLPEGLPVSVGAADSVAAALAMGAVEPGASCIAMGSSTIVIDAVDHPLLDARMRYLVTPHALDGWFAREMDLLATGTGLRWLTALLGWSDDECMRRAAAVPPGANGLAFAPYLAGGEQGALWDPRLRGALHGLTTAHTAADIARAFLEGVHFEIRRCLDVLAESVPVRRVVAAGARPESTRLLADVLGRPLQVCEHRSPAAVGAALLAAPGPVARIPVFQEVGPSRAAADYERLYRRYASLFPRAARPPEVGDASL